MFSKHLIIFKILTKLFNYHLHLNKKLLVIAMIILLRKQVKNRISKKKKQIQEFMA